MKTMAGVFLNIDCFDKQQGMSKLMDKSINLIISDLPYGQTSNSWDFPLDLDKLWKEYERIIEDDGNIALCAKGDFMIELINSNRKLFRYEWIWNKKKGANFAHVRYRPLNVHEYILIFYKKVGTYNPQMENGKPYRQFRKEDSAVGIADSMTRSNLTICDGERYPKSIITVPGIAQRHIVHPTQKPVELFEYIIKTYTNEGDMVLDNCAGVATTAIACIRNNRNYICHEKEKEFFDKGMEMIEKERSEKIKNKKRGKGLLEFVTP